METFKRWLRKATMLMRREKFDAELREEMEYHRERAAQQLKGDGLEERDAEHAAQRQFGNTLRAQETSREVFAFGFETFAADLRFAVRQLRKNPGFAATAVAVLALGVAASVAIFGFVDAALIKPLPYRDAEKLVGVYERAAIIPRSNLSYFDYLDWKSQNRVFTSLEAWSGTGYLFRTSEGLQPVPGARVSAGFFRMLGVQPALGRDFAAGEDARGGPRLVMLSFAGWQRWFGGRTDVIGQKVTLSNEPYTVIGVLPKEFQFALRGQADFWASVTGDNQCEERRSATTCGGSED